MKKITYEEFGAEALLPAPITGTQWTRWAQALRDNEDVDSITQSFRAALTLFENAVWEREGQTVPIDEDAPLALLVWLADEARAAVMEAQSVPKNLSGPPSPPPTD